MSEPPSQPPVPTTEEPSPYWCYHCDKRVSIETLANLPDVICGECKNGFVETIPTPSRSRSPSSSSDDPNFGSQFLQVLRLIAQSARDDDDDDASPPPPPSRSPENDFLRIELGGWDNNDEDDDDEGIEFHEGTVNEEHEDRSVNEDPHVDDEDLRRRRRELLRHRIRDLATRTRSMRNRILDWAEILMGLEDNSIELRLQSDRYVGNPEDYVDAAEYETLLQTLAETDGGGRKGAPPASKSAVEELPTVKIVSESETVACAICKEMIGVGEMAKKLPCEHKYPGVTDSDLAVIANGFTCLKILNLHNCKGITDVGMKAIGDGLSLLQSLDVSYCRKLTDKGLSAVAKGCCDLRILHMAGCRFVTDGILEALSKNCHNLQELGLQGCTNITDNGLINLASGCQRIKVLDINKCSNVSDVGVSSICKACSSSLRTLKLLDCYKIGDETISSLAKFCGNLETLIIGGCRDVSDDAIKLLATARRSNLKNLRMDWCLNVSDSSLSCILSQCRNLEALDIGCCEEVTDAAFHLISSEEPGLSLKILKVSNCPKITVVGIGILVGKCTYLEYLDVRSCPHITKAGLDEAGFHFPDCCKVNFNGNISEPAVLL